MIKFMTIISSIDKIDPAKLDDALRSMGTKQLKPLYRDGWSPEHPRDGYCYVLAEIAYHYLAPDGFKPCIAKSGDDGETHWFLRNGNGDVIDLVNTKPSAKDAKFYASGKSRGFLTTKISKRGSKLAELLELHDPIR